ncbi:hypothetical protein PENSPDRAFT_671730 [Peniophora sp. CONT]|nr:hypothetical protein PENSPDRAFT_671730 [Peniophora sp. CONT]
MYHVTLMDQANINELPSKPRQHFVLAADRNGQEDEDAHRGPEFSLLRAGLNTKLSSLSRGRRHNGKSSSSDSQAANDSIDHLASLTHTPKLIEDTIYELFEAAALVYLPRALVMMPTSAQALVHTHTLLGWVILMHICDAGVSSDSVLPSRHSGLGWDVDCSGDGSARQTRVVLPNLREIHLGAHLPWDFNPRWELPGLKSAWLGMTLLPHSLVVTLRELHLRLHATRIPLATLRDFLRSCPYLKALDTSITGEWSHKYLSNDTRPESVRRPERAAWKERIHFEYLKEAKVVIVLSLLPSYIPTASPCITSFTLNALAADISEFNETFGALERALTGVTTLNLKNIQFWPLEKLRLDGEWAGKGIWNESEDQEGKEETIASAVVRELVDERMGDVTVHRLILAGQWCEREGWLDIWTSQSAECRAQGLVSEVVDERVITSACDWYAVRVTTCANALWFNVQRSSTITTIYSSIQLESVKPAPMPAYTAQTLPFDILREIFDYVAAATPAGYNYVYSPGLKLGWIQLTHVCQHWRYTGLTAASLWAVSVSAFPDPSIADEILTRARNCPLTIDVIHNKHNETSWLRKALPLSWCLQHLHRARFLRCKIPMSAFVRDMFASPLPLVEVMDIEVETFDTWDDPAPPARSVQINAPALQRIRLVGMLPTPSSTLPSLRYLRLDLDDEFTPISNIADIFDLLRGLSCLESLRLFMACCKTKPAVDRSAVHLNHLRHLEAVCKSNAQALDLLEIICTPSSTKLSISTRREMDVELLNRVVAFQQRRFAGQLNEAISISETHITLSGDASRRSKFKLEFSKQYFDGPGLSFVDFLSILPRYLDVSQYRRCELVIPRVLGQEYSGLDAVVATLGQAMTSATTLVLNDVACLEVLRSLESNEGSPLVFPSLRTLSLGKEDPRPDSFRRYVFAFADSADLWWSTVKDALDSRRRRGAGVECLTLAGNQCTREECTDIWTEGGQDCLSRGIVAQLQWIDVQRKGFSLGLRSSRAYVSALTISTPCTARTCRRRPRERRLHLLSHRSSRQRDQTGVKTEEECCILNADVHTNPHLYCYIYHHGIYARRFEPSFGNLARDLRACRSGRTPGWNDTAGGYLLGWICVTHVCHRWREISLTMPRLWAEVVSAFPVPSIANELLERARKCLVRIDVCHEDHEFESGRRCLPLNWGIENLHRARILSCALPLSALIMNGNPDIHPFLTNPPSTLQHLKISTSNDLRDVDPLPVELCVPMLLSADLTNVIPSLSSNMTNLRILTLFFDESMDLTDLSAILDVLRSLNGLIRLELTLEVVEIATAHRYTAVSLEHVEILEIKGLQEPVLVFLELISAPHAIETLVVTESNWSEELLAVAAAQQKARLLYNALTVSDGHHRS